MAKAKRPRLKKSPDIPDYVVEATNFEPGVQRQVFKYFATRKEARDAAKGAIADRVRVFHCKYSLVSDSRGKK